jgi:glycosyltransferase involved in cell wall biosynthesis
MKNSQGKAAKTTIFYIANVNLPNVRAHSVQIVNTCAALGASSDCNVHLCTPSHRRRGDVFSHYRLQPTFRHRYLFAPTIPFWHFAFYTRLVTFAISVNIFLLFHIVLYRLRGQSMCIYVRGESVFSVAWLRLFVPVVFESHQIRGFSFAYRQALRAVSAVVVITDRLKYELVEKFSLLENKVLVARDAVDFNRFAEAKCSGELRQRYCIPESSTIVLYCGSLTKEKGVYTLADAAVSLPDDVVVVVAGGHGATLTTFRDYTRETPAILSIGAISYDEVPALMACSDILVQPELSTDRYSRLFTSPMKLFEYMAAGKPIIAADVPSLREVLSDEIAFFFTSGDAESLQTRILDLCSDHIKRLVIGSHSQSVARNFTWEKRAERIGEFITNLV